METTQTQTQTENQALRQRYNETLAAMREAEQNREKANRKYQREVERPQYSDEYVARNPQLRRVKRYDRQAVDAAWAEYWYWSGEAQVRGRAWMDAFDALHPEVAAEAKRLQAEADAKWEAGKAERRAACGM